MRSTLSLAAVAALIHLANATLYDRFTLLPWKDFNVTARDHHVPHTLPADDADTNSHLRALGSALHISVVPTTLVTTVTTTATSADIHSEYARMVTGVPIITDAAGLETIKRKMFPSEYTDDTIDHKSLGWSDMSTVLTAVPT